MMTANELPDPDDTIPDEIRHAVLIRASRQECHKVLTTAEGWNSWFTTSMFIDLKVGGVMVFEWKNWGADNLSTGDHGVIVDLEEGKKLSFTWHPDKPDHATRVDLSLEDAPEGCIVRVCEHGFMDNPEGMHAMLQSAVGWGEALTLLKMYLEHGIRY